MECESCARYPGCEVRNSESVACGVRASQITVGTRKQRIQAVLDALAAERESQGSEQTDEP